MIRLDPYTERIIHYVNCLKLGLKMDYDDFSMQELRDLEYVFLKIEQHDKQTMFDALFKGLSELFKKVLGAFK